jgi:hypothetical protein
MFCSMYSGADIPPAANAIVVTVTANVARNAFRQLDERARPLNSMAATRPAMTTPRKINE